MELADRTRDHAQTCIALYRLCCEHPAISARAGASSKQAQEMTRDRREWHAAIELRADIWQISFERRTRIGKGCRFAKEKRIDIEQMFRILVSRADRHHA